jgi:hypothetical protein
MNNRKRKCNEEKFWAATEDDGIRKELHAGPMEMGGKLE